MTESVLHHPDGTIEVPSDLHDAVFEHGQVGDWWWSGEDTDRILWLVVPDLIGRGQGRMGDRGGEILPLYVHRQPDNWGQPGPVNGWDGNETHPTLSPSILIPGGWHGFFENGHLRTA